MVDKRKKLDKGSSLELCSSKKGNGERIRYSIRQVLGKGGTCITYHAVEVKENGDRAEGTLKEFYPIPMNSNGCSFERMENNSLIAKGDMDAFQRIVDAFLSPLRALQQLRVENTEAQHINNCMPYYSIRYGIEEASTIYIWMPDVPKGLVFEEYLEKIHSAKNGNPLADLSTIIMSVFSLARWVAVLHREGYLHLDLKPGNFIITEAFPETVNPYQLMVCDVDSIELMPCTHVDHWSSGFSAPELKLGKADVRADIYSLGAILFYAILFPQVPEPDVLEYETVTLAGQLSHSRLFDEIDDNSKVYLEYKIANILKRCIHPYRSKRYRSCLSLIKDLEDLINSILPLLWMDRLDESDRSKMKEILLPDSKELDTTSMMQALLCNVPLYKYLPMDGKAEDHVLIIGEGTFAQTFLDHCLQAAQNGPANLNITYATLNPEKEKRVYLAGRPAMKQFVSIDGDKVEDSFATISFVGRKIAIESASMEELVPGISLANKNSYIFISTEMGSALMSDHENATAAHLCTSQASEHSAVLYVLSQSDENVPNAIPVPLYDKQYDTWISPRHYSLACGLHDIWCPDDMPLEKRAETFRDRYNFRASLAFAGSILYKKAAADKLQTSEEDAEAIYEDLAYYEHRRWIMEKLVAGWRPFDAQELACTLESKNETHKKHACIVKGANRRPLQCFSETEWMNADLSDLDPLDQVSVTIYRNKKAHDNNAQPLDYKQYDYDMTKWALQMVSEKTIKLPEWAISETAGHYVPNPVDTSTVELPTSLTDLTEQIASNVHEEWAKHRMAEGWSYGEVKDSRKKTTPSLVPYELLPESEKEYDRNTAIETLKLIYKLGYTLKGNDG